MEYLSNNSIAKKFKWLAAILVSLSLVLWFTWKPIRINQHLLGGRRAWQLMEYQPPTFDDAGVIVPRETAWVDFILPLLGVPEDPGERYEYHRDALVELGYFVHRDFQFKNIRAKTKHSNKLWKLRGIRFPNHLHVSMNFEDAPAIISVWDTPERMPSWEQFVRQHDIPNFEQRFLSGNSDL